MPQERPIPESYWVLPGQFLAGEHPARSPHPETRLDSFLEAGFDAFFDLTSPGELPPYEPLLRERASYYGRKIQYANHPIGDYGLPSADQMRQLLQEIENALVAGRKIYLHCYGGIGRTGTAIGCYLAQNGHPGPHALEQLADWWQAVPKARFHPHSPETEAQAEFVRKWKR